MPFLGSLRSTAQLISYELILSSAILLVVMLVSSLDITVIIEAQNSIWYILPLFPIFIIFFIGSIAETNRAPFDLAEAESELVSGFMTEHSAVIFVFFFLAEYASIILICIFNSVLFLGGYLVDFNYFNYFIYPYLILTKYISGDNYMYITENGSNYNLFSLTNIDIITVATIFGIAMGIKTCIMIFTFIWARASFPRIRYDQLMSYCWTVLLPIVIAFIIIVPCILYFSEILPSNMIALCCDDIPSQPVSEKNWAFIGISGIFCFYVLAILFSKIPNIWRDLMFRHELFVLESILKSLNGEYTELLHKKLKSEEEVAKRDLEKKNKKDQINYYALAWEVKTWEYDEFKKIKI